MFVGVHVSTQLGVPKAGNSKHLDIQVLVGYGRSWIFIVVILWRVPTQAITLRATAL